MVSVSIVCTAAIENCRLLTFYSFYLSSLLYGDVNFENVNSFESFKRCFRSYEVTYLAGQIEA